MSLRLRPISRQEHLAFIATRPSVSFLQCPAWAQVKSEWASESLGWLDEFDQIKGAGLVLYRKVPRLKRYLAYLPEGPAIDWSDGDLRQWLDPLVDYMKGRNAFGIKLGPPVTDRVWRAETIKDAIATKAAKRLPDLPADGRDPLGAQVREQLSTMGWHAPPDETGFSPGQPRYVFQVPLAGRDLDGIFAGFNQLWRRNVRKAERSGVQITLGDSRDLPTFHELYRLTSERDRFTGRPLAYFEKMYSALAAEAPDRIRLYLAKHEGETLAATLWVRVGDHVWYSYGASANHKREVRPSNAIQWQMLKDAYAAGADVYDMRGISDTLDESDHLFGLIQFKLGTGGQAVEHIGEWDLPLNKLLYKAFEAYLAVR
ncbi:MAG TPA: peptidoglycan bridge formation glycyltransferase FemA/FemB family protein [Actinomycetes bacterium]|jgi:lipid II:glycine glycyltransferase (peptidoglycan interpeptide bridge formation enzyme)|nr:peptidoglycan bridge formation glycyltransferase FemA/FemB family protein [Actinomycetes bacterium]